MQLKCNCCEGTKGLAVATGVVLTSMPPQKEFMWTCNGCGHTQRITRQLEMPKPETIETE